MTETCVACGNPIVEGDVLASDNTWGLSIASDVGIGFFDGVVGYCSEECAPAELTGVSYEKSPLQKLVQFFHESNTEDSIEYWMEDRGWDRETVDELLLGWAPPDEYAAYEYLKSAGYSNGDILSTGAFYPGDPPFSCIWKGRYVFPYYGASGEATYLISRRVETDMSEYKDVDSDMYGHPADDRGGQKYSKLTKTKPYAIYDEPIYGIESIVDSDFVLIAEGIADAITAIEKGYPVLSPVTVSFKDKHYSEVAELIVENDIDQVFIVPDSEEIQDSQRETGVDVSVGLFGGLKTAVELEERVEQETSIRVVDLPRPDDIAKIDLDEFLQTHGSDRFDELLVNASDPDEFDAYEDIKQKVEAMKQAAAEQSSSFDKSSGEYSELFDLSILDVLPDGFNPDVRNPNPLGHIGDSENYFALNNTSGDIVAYDHKRKVGYNALTYILCEIGERSPDSPNGSLSDKEIWLCWKWCKENDIFRDEADPIPSSALNHIAREMGYDVSGDEMLPYEVYSDALEYVESEYNIDPGRTAQAQNTGQDSTEKSPYFTRPIESIIPQIDEDTTLPKGFEYENETWTADETPEPGNSLSLIAVLEEFIDPADVTVDWMESLTPIEFLELCLIGRRKYYLSGDLPYKAIQGIAEFVGVDEYYDEEQKIVKYADRSRFEQMYRQGTLYYDLSTGAVKQRE
jgi:hypothetical protein